MLMKVPADSCLNVEPADSSPCGTTRLLYMHRIHTRRRASVHTYNDLCLFSCSDVLLTRMEFSFDPEKSARNATERHLPFERVRKLSVQMTGGIGVNGGLRPSG
jgi:hypothetical protein